MLSGAREAGCYREVVALRSDHLGQVPLYHRFSVAKKTSWRKPSIDNVVFLLEEFLDGYRVYNVTRNGWNSTYVLSVCLIN